jgi:hypothetical protein
MNFDFPAHWISAHRWDPYQYHLTNVDDIIVDVEIELWDNDDIELNDPDDLADITPKSGRKFVGYYDLQRDQLFYEDDSEVTKRNGYYRIEGTADDNARIQFDISDNCDIEPDLDTDGGPFSWSNVDPGDTRTDTLYVENIGDSKSMLNWKVSNKPDWVTISPESGNNLKPEDGDIDLTVTATAPSETDTTLSGTIKIKNIEKESDYEQIQISISTVQGNQPPVISNPSPQNGASDQPTNILFEWDCEDGDGDTVDFDFYLGLSEDNLIKINSEPFQEEEFQPPTLYKSKKYYWKIVADDGEDETQGPIWNFRTVADGSLTVDAGGPYHGKPNEDIRFEASANGGVEPYSFAWDFDNDDEFDDADTRVAYSSWNSEGSYYYVEVQVTDDLGNTATDTCDVHVRKSRARDLILNWFISFIEKYFGKFMAYELLFQGQLI